MDTSDLDETKQGIEDYMVIVTFCFNFFEDFQFEVRKIKQIVIWEHP